MKVRYRLTDAAVRAEFVRTGEMPAADQALEFPAADLMADDRRRWAERFGTATDAGLTARIPGPSYATDERFTADRIHADGPALVREFLDWADGLIDADRARRQAKWDNYARAVVAAAQMPAEELEADNIPARPYIATTGLDGIEPIDTLVRELKAGLGRRAAAREAARDAEKAAARAKAENERKAWVEAHGSDHLRKACRAGYDCQRKYVTERAALEFPGFAVDFDDLADWKARSCPGEEALDAAEAAGEGAEVVWLTRPAYAIDDPDCMDEPEWESREAVVVRGFLGKYDLIREV